MRDFFAEWTFDYVRWLCSMEGLSRGAIQLADRLIFGRFRTSSEFGARYAPDEDSVLSGNDFVSSNLLRSFKFVT